MARIYFSKTGIGSRKKEMDNSRIIMDFISLFLEMEFMLPSCLGLSFVVQKTKNNTIGISAHSIGNGMALIPNILGIPDKKFNFCLIYKDERLFKQYYKEIQINI